MLDAAFLVSFKFSKCQLRELRKVCVCVCVCVCEREREVKGGTYRLIKVVKSERFAIETTYFSGAVLCSAFLKVLAE